MKYVSFVIGIILVVLIGAFVWNIVSGVFIGVDTNMFNGDNSSQDDEIVFEPVDNPVDENTDQNQNATNNDTDTTNDSDKVEPTTPVSQREGVVSISSVRNSSSFNRAQEIRLRSNLEEDEVVNITGWIIQTNEERVKIPKGVNFYDVTSSNSEGSIVLDKGDSVRINFDEGLISKNLRLNQCTGYLNEKHDLDNFFPNDCPKVEKEKYRHLSGSCQDYINDINGDCVTPDAETLNSFPGSDEGNACRQFLSSHFNAGYCMRENKNSSDFLSDEWRVWIDKAQVLDSQHDWIRLYNKNGILIDERDY